MLRWAGGRVSVLAGEAAGMAVMGEVGDAQAKNIHTVEKFEKNVRKRWFIEPWCLEFLQQSAWMFAVWKGVVSKQSLCRRWRQCTWESFKCTYPSCFDGTIVSWGAEIYVSELSGRMTNFSPLGNHHYLYIFISPFSY